MAKAVTDPSSQWGKARHQAAHEIRAVAKEVEEGWAGLFMVLLFSTAAQVDGIPEHVVLLGRIFQ